MSAESKKAFEEWAIAHGYFDCGYWDAGKQRYAGDLRAAYHGYSAACEHIRAKLQSDGVAVGVADALFENEKKTMGDAWYHPSETFKGLGSIAREPWIKNAKAAIAAVLEHV